MPAPQTYTFRSDLFTAETTVSLEREGLRIARKEGEAKTIPWGQIERVRTSREPVKGQPDRFFCRIWIKGERWPAVAISPFLFRGMFNLEKQHGAYRAFVIGLHERIHEKAPGVTFWTGLSPATFWVLAVFLSAVITIFAGAGLLQLQSAERDQMAWLILLPFAVASIILWALFRWAKPCQYRHNEIPPGALPAEGM
jgi:hypothetical protein